MFSERRPLIPLKNFRMTREEGVATINLRRVPPVMKVPTMRAPALAIFCTMTIHPSPWCIELMMDEKSYWSQEAQRSRRPT
jgi:hypothetical protein